MKLTFTERKDNLIIEMVQMVVQLIIATGGEDSKDFSYKVLKPDDNFQYNLDGHPSGSYVVEVTENKLISNFGHEYSFDCLGIDELCELIDHLEKKYS